MTEQPHGTVTFLFTDIEGSTRLLRELGSERYAGALAEHRRLLRDAFARHGGYEVDSEGDAFFVAFGRPGNALAACAEAQNSLAGHDWPEGQQVRVRMGVHSGEALLAPPKYVGIDVHRAARVMAAGHGGQVLVTESTARLLGDTLPDGLGLLDLGEHRLKDFDGALTLYQLCFSGGPATFPPLVTISNANLPRPASSFVGREQERAEVVELLRREDVRMLTLTGPGGSGKTRLAIEAASKVVTAYPAGVFWIGLAPLVDPTLVTPAIAKTLGAKDDPAAHIGERHMLLLLDNMEQVIEAAPELARLLEACPNLTVLATSREALRLAGENEYALAPLAEADAVELFYERAGEAGAKLAGDAPVPAICKHLDNLPLAVELAAARTKALSGEQLLERLERRLPLLTGGRRDAPERQRTLRATIAWSCDLLGDEEQRLFAHLAVFAGGWTLEAAERVCDAELDTLVSLLDKSLLRHTYGRFWMLETIREYAHEQLDTSGKAEQTRRRHAEHFLGLAQEAGPHLSGPEQVKWLGAVEQEHENFRAALTRLRDANEGERELQLAVALSDFWVTRGYAREGRTWLKDALARGKDARHRVRALHAAGFLASRQGDYEEAEALLEEGLARSRDLGEPDLVARLLLTLAGVVSAQGDERRAAALYGQLRELLPTLGDEAAAPAHMNLADWAIGRGDYPTARRDAEQSFALYRGTGHIWGMAGSLLCLGLACLGHGEDGEARTQLEESLRLSARLGDNEGIGRCLSVLAAVAQERGDAAKATQLLARSEALFEEIDGELDGVERAVHDLTLTKVRSELAAGPFENLWSQGRSLSLEEAVNYALSDELERVARP